AVLLQMLRVLMKEPTALIWPLPATRRGLFTQVVGAE
ncbi:MAG: hypothetical protein ACI9FB_003167, partial [Candidatus Azotimanducaceae bacterium]